MEMENGRVMSGSGQGLRLSEALGSDADRVGPAAAGFSVFSTIRSLKRRLAGTNGDAGFWQKCCATDYE